MNIDIVLYCICFIPIGLMEIYISKTKYSSTALSKAPTKSKDRGTFIFIWFTVICSQVMAVHCAKAGYASKIISDGFFKYFVWFPSSISLILMSVYLRVQSIEQLGKWFTMTVRTAEDQPLIDTGLYGKVRHPSYAGVLMYFLVSTLLLNNWLSLCTSMIPIFSAFRYRIYVEEQELKTHFRQKYEEYIQKVPYMIIPKIF